MKKDKLCILAAMAVVALSSCKSKEGAYKEAYMRAQEKEITQTPSTTPAAEPVVTKKPAPTYTGAALVEEELTAVTSSDAANLFVYNVVVGSFMNQTNATALKAMLVKDGFNAVLAKNKKGMFRVIAASFDTREQATASRESIKRNYPNRFNDAWLLIRVDE